MFDGVAGAIDIGLASEVLVAVDDVAATAGAGVSRELANMLDGVAGPIDVGLDGEVLTPVDGVIAGVVAGVG